MGAISGGLLAVARGVMVIVGYVRRDDPRLSATAAVIGVTVLAWHVFFAATTSDIMLFGIGLDVRSLFDKTDST